MELYLTHHYYLHCYHLHIMQLLRRVHRLLLFYHSNFYHVVIFFCTSALDRFHRLFVHLGGALRTGSNSQSRCKAMALSMEGFLAWHRWQSKTQAFGTLPLCSLACKGHSPVTVHGSNHTVPDCVGFPSPEPPGVQGLPRLCPALSQGVYRHGIVASGMMSHEAQTSSKTGMTCPWRTK